MLYLNKRFIKILEKIVNDSILLYILTPKGEMAERSKALAC